MTTCVSALAFATICRNTSDWLSASRQAAGRSSERTTLNAKATAVTQAVWRRLIWSDSPSQTESLKMCCQAPTEGRNTET